MTSSRSTNLIFAALGAALAVAAFGGAPGNAAAAPLAGEPLAQRWCAQCHAVKPGGVSPEPKAPSFGELAAQPSITEYSLRILLRTPHESMPDLILKPEDLDDLVGYIVSLKPKP